MRPFIVASGLAPHLSTRTTLDILVCCPESDRYDLSARSVIEPIRELAKLRCYIGLSSFEFKYSINLQY
jgi:hypothetical protein